MQLKRPHCSQGYSLRGVQPHTDWLTQPSWSGLQEVNHPQGSIPFQNKQTWSLEPAETPNKAKLLIKTQCCGQRISGAAENRRAHQSHIVTAKNNLGSMTDYKNLDLVKIQSTTRIHKMYPITE